MWAARETWQLEAVRRLLVIFPLNVAIIFEFQRLLLFRAGFVQICVRSFFGFVCQWLNVLIKFRMYGVNFWSRAPSDMNFARMKAKIHRGKKTTKKNTLRITKISFVRMLLQAWTIALIHVICIELVQSVLTSEFAEFRRRNTVAVQQVKHKTSLGFFLHSRWFCYRRRLGFVPVDAVGFWFHSRITCQTCKC